MAKKKKSAKGKPKATFKQKPAPKYKFQPLTQGPPPQQGPPPPPQYAPQAFAPDPLYIAQQGAALAQMQSDQAALEREKQAASYEYGFDDTTNPYSRAVMLQKAFEQSQKTNLNNMAGQGQLYSGANQAIQDEGTFTRGRNYDALRRDYTSQIQNIGQRGLQAQRDYSTGNIGAYGDMLERQLEFPTVASPVAPLAAKPKLKAAPKPKPKKKKPKPKKGLAFQPVRQR